MAVWLLACAPLLSLHSHFIRMSAPNIPRPVLVVGSINADVFLEVPRLPAPGETLAATSDTVMLPGGKGANQAAAAGRLSGCSRMLGQIGATDSFGKEVLDQARVCHVDTSLVVEHPTASSGQAYIFLQASGENSIVIIGGANQAWPDDPFTQAARSAFQDASCCLLQREIPEFVNVAAARLSSEARIPVILDAGGVEEPISDELLALCTCISPNETELARLTGLPTGSDTEVVSAARALQGKGVNEVLVKLGSRGCVLVRGAESEAPIWQAARVVTQVVDTTGAGDCFTGAYAVACAEGKAPADALAFATTAASLAIQKKGAMNSMPARNEVDQLMSS